jgi:hypothetical protein
MSESATILKNPVYANAASYEWLRAQGLKYIEQLSSAYWTDYNIHDPGITLLEALCYAITDLGYRTSLDIKDLLASYAGGSGLIEAEKQAFYSPATILTVNPWTSNDFRKLLIDLNGVKNAWLICSGDSCNDKLIYADCANSKLQYEVTGKPISIEGLKDVLIEFDTEPGMGDLNSGKINQQFFFLADDTLASGVLELRLPSWQALQQDVFALHAKAVCNAVIEQVKVLYVSGNKSDNSNIPQSQLAKVLRSVFYATIEVTYKPLTEGATPLKWLLGDVPCKLWLTDDNHRKIISVNEIIQSLEDNSETGALARYFSLLQRAAQVMQQAFFALHNHRNLAEDFCKVSAVSVHDVGVCADIEVTPSAEIEAVLAEVYYRIGEYFSPEVKFNGLNDLVQQGMPTDDIFDGPVLRNGFIIEDELKHSQLKLFIYTSDIINSLMDIPGVVAVRNFVLMDFDSEGKHLDSFSWILNVRSGHQPRLYIEASKILFYKNGLPFLPQWQEVTDTLQVLKGKNSRPQPLPEELDFAIPPGELYDLTGYEPVQYTLPVNYGIGTAGLNDAASAERKAKAAQLKAYLITFEHLLLHYMHQLASMGNLFSNDTGITQTYYSKLITSDDLPNIELLYDGLAQGTLDSLLEDEETFLNRRNRLLDHMLSRFAENVNEYALMLYTYSSSRAVASAQLVYNKAKLLQAYPQTSANRARAFNYKWSENILMRAAETGLAKRIKLLLGLEGVNGLFELYDELDEDGIAHELRWRLRDNAGNIYLSSSTRYVGSTKAESERLAWLEIGQVRTYMANSKNYEVKKVKKWVINLLNDNGDVIATRKQYFSTKAAAEAVLGKLLQFVQTVVLAERVWVVEHLLLRPRFWPGMAGLPVGDPLLSVCLSPDCSQCTDADAYSNRITIVMNGELGVANSGIEFRQFAEEIIRREVPAHLGVKICWVSVKQMLQFEEVYLHWLSQLAGEAAPAALQLALHNLLLVFDNLKSVYPEARLHDCADGDDSNRVFLNRTII